MNLGQKNYEIIADELQRMIQTERLKPGQKIDTIENLAAQYRVGRSTIREALSYLKAHGLIESKQGGGTYVAANALHSTLEQMKSANQEDLCKLMQMREIVEVGGVELAARYRTEADIADLSRSLQQMEDAIGNEEISQLHDANFHLSIARASQNPYLRTMMEGLSASLRDMMQASRRLWLRQVTQTPHLLVEEHKAIYEAIVQQDVRQASRMMKQHLEQVMQSLPH
ncbi:FadR/GntR family transcriptional regulator [Paenibacillus xerothermodurans]|uniref:FadR family transcriptional regulator n=1 Tax=Paenibacillus xerothermodurans TaxID=1977292 RepID=A0A2W1NM60_PAEXE|nr:FadR/GntR family transcriptional regulator [Paenibacillus xerothermodurans]PZE20545.1 FadR family transcriptional regulator [Paenibacillus xerothermodurans]